MKMFFPRQSATPLALAAICCVATLSWASDYVPTGRHLPAPEMEFRGLWVASVYNLDWPSRPGLSAEAQREEWRTLVRMAADTGFNAIVLQVRPTADALYRTSREPWSQYLTGRQGGDPGYDPLAFAIEEAHSAGLQLHAWFNPFRARVESSAPATGQHVTRRRPEWVRSYGKLSWMDPGIPAVRDWVLETIAEVVKNYDIDGVHLDDYFYPYPVRGARGEKLDFPDGATWAVHGAGRDISEWRRDNVNDFIRRLKQAVQREKPWVMVGISPFGIWQPGVPPGIEGRLDACDDLYADSRLWLREGWLDYFSPQLYWPRGGPQDYDRLLRWWAAQNVRGRHLWPGLALDRIGRDRDAAHIATQIALSRRGSPCAGHLLWHWSALRQNKGGIRLALKNGPYKNFALVPSSGWLTAAMPAAPRLRVRAIGDSLELMLTIQGSAPVRWWLVQWPRGEKILRARAATTTTNIPVVDHITVTPIGQNGRPGQSASLARR